VGTLKVASKFRFLCGIILFYLAGSQKLARVPDPAEDNKKPR